MTTSIISYWHHQLHDKWPNTFITHGFRIDIASYSKLPDSHCSKYRNVKVHLRSMLYRCACTFSHIGEAYFLEDTTCTQQFGWASKLNTMLFMYMFIQVGFSHEVFLAVATSKRPLSSVTEDMVPQRGSWLEWSFTHGALEGAGVTVASHVISQMSLRLEWPVA